MHLRRRKERSKEVDLLLSVQEGRPRSLRLMRSPPRTTRASIGPPCSNVCTTSMLWVVLAAVPLMVLDVAKQAGPLTEN